MNPGFCPRLVRGLILAWSRLSKHSASTCRRPAIEHCVAPHCPFTCPWPVHHGLSTLGGTPQCAEGVAGRFAGAAVARADGDTEEPHIEPGGRALHGICPRRRKIHCW